ncbi:hypothetical protein [Glutamicibacter sp. TV12E]|uniref:hypothetical protein n=1 Tax=Glutamicibacter sp. TV12E TaxID=3446362 RepID=UPI004034A11B
MNWQIIVSALTGAVAASLVTIIFNWRMKLREERYEQKRWVREKRYGLYLDLLDFSKSLHDEDDERNHNDRGREMQDFKLKTRLIGSIPVYVALENLDDEHYNSGFRSDQTPFEIAREKLYRELRTDLGTYDTPAKKKFFKRNT